MTLDAATVVKECEDYLFPRLLLNVRERSLYYHLLRHTRLDDKPSALFAMAPLAAALGVSESTSREDIRSLNEKGCIRIEERSRLGHLVTVLLPEEIEGVIPLTASAPEVDLSLLDFFNGRRFIGAILEREAHRCFYCLKDIRPDSCELDHVVARMNGTDHGFKNIVAACHDCNTTKQASAPADFLRSLFRKGRLSAPELEERLAALEQLQSGLLIPNASLVSAAL